MSDGKNLIKEKSYQFALRVIELYRKLCKQNEFVLSRQLLRSGTSIGANVEEATAAQSRKDFIAKMAVASKEARETHYWLRLLRDSKLYSGEDLLEECSQIIRILTSIVKTTQQTNPKPKIQN